LSFVFSDKGILVPKGLRYPSAILPGLDDYYRTRLTHSIEVAQIGRTIAKGLRLNESLAEAICLAHDLGHSPFGHAGEKVLNDLMTESGGFEQNLPEL
jgi:dGTPase